LRIPKIVAVVAAMTILAACGAEPSPDSSDNADPSTSSEISPETGLPVPEVTSLKLGVAALAVSSISTFVADEQGIFDKYGLDVEVTQLEGDGPAGQALTAGQLDGMVSGGGPAVSARAAGTDLTAVMVTRTAAGDVLAVSDDVQSGEDLKGKQIAISTYGGDSHIAVLAALGELGLKAEDVTIVQIGGQGDRYAALQAGAVAAAPVEGIPDEELAEAGLHPLIKLGDTDLALPRGTVIFPQDFIDENPNTVLNVVAALLEAQSMTKADPALALDTFAKASDISVDEAKPVVEPNLAALPDDGRMSEEMFAPLKEALTATNPAIEQVDLSEVYTNEFIDQIEKAGLFEKLGIPGS